MKILVSSSVGHKTDLYIFLSPKIDDFFVEVEDDEVKAVIVVSKVAASEFVATFNVFIVAVEVVVVVVCVVVVGVVVVVVGIEIGPIFIGTVVDSIKRKDWILSIFLIY